APYHAIDELEVFVGKGAVGSFEGEDDPAGEDILGESLLQQLVAPYTSATRREKADVIVRGGTIPVGGNTAQEDAGCPPGQATRPRMVGGQASEELVHAHLPCRQPEREPVDPAGRESCVERA